MREYLPLSREAPNWKDLVWDTGEAKLVGVPRQRDTGYSSAQGAGTTQTVYYDYLIYDSEALWGSGNPDIEQERVRRIEFTLTEVGDKSAYVKLCKDNEQYSFLASAGKRMWPPLDSVVPGSAGVEIIHPTTSEIKMPEQNLSVRIRSNPDDALRPIISIVFDKRVGLPEAIHKMHQMVWMYSQLTVKAILPAGLAVSCYKSSTKKTAPVYRHYELEEPRTRIYSSGVHEITRNEVETLIRNWLSDAKLKEDFRRSIYQAIRKLEQDSYWDYRDIIMDLSAGIEKLPMPKPSLRFNKAVKAEAVEAAVQALTSETNLDECTIVETRKRIKEMVGKLNSIPPRYRSEHMLAKIQSMDLPEMDKERTRITTDILLPKSYASRQNKGHLTRKKEASNFQKATAEGLLGFCLLYDFIDCEAGNMDSWILDNARSLFNNSLHLSTGTAYGYEIFQNKRENRMANPPKSKRIKGGSSFSENSWHTRCLPVKYWIEPDTKAQNVIETIIMQEQHFIWLTDNSAYAATRFPSKEDLQKMDMKIDHAFSNIPVGEPKEHGGYELLCRNADGEVMALGTDFKSLAEATEVAWQHRKRLTQTQ